MIHRIAMVLVVVFAAGTLWAADEPPDESAVCTVAVFPFAERGPVPAGSGGQVADLLFAALSEDPDLILVERAETDKILQEQELYLTGLTHPDQALKLGWMTGARVLVTGSVMASGERVICLAKVIGSETGRVLGKSVKGARDDIPDLAAELADAVGDILDNQRARLIPPEEKTEDRVDRLKKRLAGGKRPTVSIRIAEEHVGRPVIDPAAQTEFQLICRQTGFEVFDPGAGRAVDIRIAGEAFSAFALRRGNLISVKARGGGHGHRPQDRPGGGGRPGHRHRGGPGRAHRRQDGPGKGRRPGGRADAAASGGEVAKQKSRKQKVRR
jgi:TolB-like protein